AAARSLKGRCCGTLRYLRDISRRSTCFGFLLRRRHSTGASFVPNAGQHLECERASGGQVLCFAKRELEMRMRRQGRRLAAATLLDCLRGYFVQGVAGDAEGNAHRERCDRCRKAEPKRLSTDEIFAEQRIRERKRHLIGHKHILEAVVATARCL